LTVGRADGELLETQRQRLIATLKDKLGIRKLVWVGTRGHDARALLDFPQLTEAYGITAPLGSVSVLVDFALEQVSKQRVDLDVYSIDQDRSEPANQLRRLLLESLTEPTVVVAYRPLALLSALCYPRSDFVSYIGMFHERQLTFEHKPWVESELRRLGIPVIPWKYYADEDRGRLERQVIATGTLVVRTNRSNGGAGLTAVSSPGEVSTQLQQTKDGFLAAAPLLEPHIPLNVNACVFGDGTVTLHPPSLQLIGIPEFTSRQFGYCGNDFAAIRNLDSKLLTEFGLLVRQTGRWLWSQGYLGAFGVDALIYDGKVYVVEVNPRFQGSSLLSARLDRIMGCADVFLCHIAAHLNQSAPQQMSLEELVHHQIGYSQIIYHNQTQSFVEGSPRLKGDEFFEVEIAPGDSVLVQRNATICRAVTPFQVTSDGRSVSRQVLERLKECFGLTPEVELQREAAQEA
jgi:hypothetical protein